MNNVLWNAIVKYNFLLIIMAIIAIILAIPFKLAGNSTILGQTLFDLLILSTVYLILFSIFSIYHSFISCLIGGTLGGLFLVLDIASVYFDSMLLMIASQSLMLVFITFTIYYISTNLINKIHINTNIMYGVITTFVLAGIWWSKIYWLINAYEPGAFRGVEPLLTIENAHQVQFDLLYFSLTTLSTLGMGDISPLTNFAKSFTILEAIFGQLYIAITIAKMVNIWKLTYDKKKTEEFQNTFK